MWYYASEERAIVDGTRTTRNRERRSSGAVTVTLESIPRYKHDRVSRLGEHAVVVGASVAGLTSARVLGDAFDRVTVLEKDPLPEKPSSRPGVPQGAQIHALLEAGRATLEDLLPGFGEELLSAGGLMIDGSTDVHYYDEGGFLADGTRRFPAYSASRPLFEAVIRRLVTERDGIQLRSGCQVIEYLKGESGDSVVGIRTRDQHSEIEEISADLVVDATGRTSRTPAWLREHGYPSPPVDEVDIDIAYSTIAIERPPDDRRAILGVASHPRTRGCAVFPIEQGRWLVNLHGVHGDHPPRGVEAFHEFAESLPVAEVPRLLEAHPSVSEGVEYYPFPANRRHYYETLEAFPDGLLVIGDAIASFNPIYGQGMSVAALEALSLHHSLADEGLENLALGFFDRAEGIVDTAWMMAVGADFAFPQTTGPKPPGTDLFGRYMSRLIRKAQTDSTLRDALFSVIMMEEPPTALLRPRVVWRVAKPGASTESTTSTGAPGARSRVGGERFT